MLRNLLALILFGMLAIGGYIFTVTRDLPPVEKILHDGVNPTQWTQVFAANGTPIMSFGKFRHQNVRLKDVSPYFIEALIATEDRRFYSHHGVDPIAVLRAIMSDLSHKKIREGGSTITQQLARNVFLNNERSFSRKIREAALAWELEDKLDKKQIMELYVNNTYFGEGAYGIRAASEVYFGKPPSRLTVPEAAMLAGMPQAPSGYSPFHNMRGALQRRNEVLQNLVEVGQISSEQCAKFQKQPIRLSLSGRNLASSDKAPFFNRSVMEKVMRDFNLDEQSFWQSGLKIYTTLDLNAQMLAENAVLSQSSVYGRNRASQQASLISIDPRTGAILAYVGGKNYQQSQFDRVRDAIRSPGSLFKVFTYTTAIDRGYEPNRVYLDEAINFGGWQPQNYDKSHHGYMTIARALMTSNNIVAVKVIKELGADAVAHMAEQMGIHTPMENYLGLTLGGSGVRLLDITSAFGVLANQGVRVEPYAIRKIVDDAGHEIYRELPVRTNVLNRTTVDTMIKMMEGVMTRGTGRTANIGRPLAGKTGTSDNYHDAWLVAFTPDVVTGVWVGNDDNTTMPHMTGGTLPAAIWKAFMQPYMASRPIQDFDLAYSKPLDDADFLTFSIKNLSDKESGNGAPVAQQDPVDDPVDPTLDPATAVPNTNDNGPLNPPESQAAPSGNWHNAGDRQNPPDSVGRPLVPVPAPDSEPAPQQPQPMPGYGPNAGGNRTGYGVIPIERGRRARLLAPPSDIQQLEPPPVADGRGY
jgi:penicillin-binding protein 1A